MAREIVYFAFREFHRLHSASILDMRNEMFTLFSCNISEWADDGGMKQYFQSVLQLVGTVFRGVLVLPFVAIGIFGITLVKLGEWGAWLADWTTDMSHAITIALRPKFWSTFRELQEENADLLKRIELLSKE